MVFLYKLALALDCDNKGGSRAGLPITLVYFAEKHLSNVISVKASTDIYDLKYCPECGRPAHLYDQCLKTSPWRWIRLPCLTLYICLRLQHCLNVLLSSLQYHLHKETRVPNPKCIHNRRGGLRIHLGVNTLGGFWIFAAGRDSVLSQQ